MLFGTAIGYVPGSVGVAPGTLTMQLGDPRIANCPPDPVWNYFPPIGQLPTYASPVERCNPAVIPAPAIDITPPNLPPTTSTPSRPTGVKNPPTTVVRPIPPPTQTPPRPLTRYELIQQKKSGVQGTHDLHCFGCGLDDHGTLMPYANDVRLAGAGFGDTSPGPFGMTWGGFLGVVGLALAGGVGLGYLSRR